MTWDDCDNACFGVVFFAFVAAALFLAIQVQCQDRYKRVCNNEVYWNRGKRVLCDTDKQGTSDGTTQGTFSPGDDKTYVSLDELQGLLKGEPIDQDRLAFWNLDIDTPPPSLSKPEKDKQFHERVREISWLRLKSLGPNLIEDWLGLESQDHNDHAQQCRDAVARVHYYCVFLPETASDELTYYVVRKTQHDDVNVTFTCDLVNVSNGKVDKDVEVTFSIAKGSIGAGSAANATNGANNSTANGGAPNADGIATKLATSDVTSSSTWDNIVSGGKGLRGPLFVDLADLGAAALQSADTAMSSQDALDAHYAPCRNPAQDPDTIPYRAIFRSECDAFAADFTQHTNPDFTWSEWFRNSWPVPMCTIYLLVGLFCSLVRGCASPLARTPIKNIAKHPAQCAKMCFGAPGQLCLAFVVMLMDIATVWDDPTRFSRKFGSADGPQQGPVAGSMLQGVPNSVITGTASFMMDMIAVCAALNKWAPGRGPCPGDTCSGDPKYQGGYLHEKTATLASGNKLPEDNDSDTFLKDIIHQHETGLKYDQFALGEKQFDAKLPESNNALLFERLASDIFIRRQSHEGLFIGLGMVLFAGLTALANYGVLGNVAVKGGLCRGDTDQIKDGVDCLRQFSPVWVRQIWYYALIFLDLGQVGQVAMERTNRAVLRDLDKSGYGRWSSDKAAVTTSVGSTLAGGEDVEDEAWQWMVLQTPDQDVIWKAAQREFRRNQALHGPVEDLQGKIIAPLHIVRRFLTWRFGEEKSRLQALVHDHTAEDQIRFDTPLMEITIATKGLELNSESIQVRNSDFVASFNRFVGITANDEVKKSIDDVQKNIRHVIANQETTENLGDSKAKLVGTIDALERKIEQHKEDQQATEDAKVEKTTTSYDLALSLQFYRHALARLSASEKDYKQEFVGMETCFVALFSLLRIENRMGVLINLGGGLAAHMIDTLCWHGARCDNPQFYDLPQRMIHGKAWDATTQHSAECVALLLLVICSLCAQSYRFGVSSVCKMQDWRCGGCLIIAAVLAARTLSPWFAVMAACLYCWCRPVKPVLIQTDTLERDGETWKVKGLDITALLSSTDKTKMNTHDKWEVSRVKEGKRKLLSITKSEENKEPKEIEISDLYNTGRVKKGRVDKLCCGCLPCGTGLPDCYHWPLCRRQRECCLICCKPANDTWDMNVARNSNILETHNEADTESVEGVD